MTKLQSRYPGARPFETEQQLIFRGRQEDTRMLFQKTQLEKLVVLYGKSGTGKSSLLNAGLIPKLRAESDWLPVRVRFKAWSEEAGHTPPADTARLSVRGGQASHKTFLDRLIPDESSLWHDVKEHFILHGGQKGLLLVVDQFEELFTYPAGQVAAFGEQLAEAMEKAVPQRYWDVLQAAYAGGSHPLDAAELELFQQAPMLKVVLSIRSDRVHLLNRLEPWLPTILKHLHELDALSPAAARQAIAEPAAMPRMDWFDTDPFLFGEEAIGCILDFLTHGKDGIFQKVEATQLQIICSAVEKRVREDRLQVVTPAQVADLGFIIEQYYENQILELPAEEQLPARRLIEDGLVFEEEERRLSLYEGQIFRHYKIRPETLRQLVDDHLLRAEPSLNGGYTYELSHDTLVAPVLKAKNRRVEEERREVAQEEERRREAEMAALRRKAEEEERKAEEEKAMREQAEAAKREADHQKQQAERALAELQQALAEIRARNLVTFRSFTDLGARLIYTLDHAEALEKLKTAAATEVEEAAKREALFSPLSELLFFFAEGGRRPELAVEAAALLLGLQPDAALADQLARCAGEKWNTREQFAPLLALLPEFSTLQARYYPVTVEVSTGSDGVFEMGSEESEWGHRNNEQLHKVKLSPYRMAVTPTTFYQFSLFSEATGRSLVSRTPYWGRFGDHPMVNVNWYEATEYANWLNVQQRYTTCYKIDKKSGSDPINQVRYDLLKWKVDWNPQPRGYRLPTEAEWELAARGGVGANRSLFSGGNELGDLSWYWENSGDVPLIGNWDLNRIYDNNCRTHPVGTKQANALGLYDMCGNVWEWCWDWFNDGYYVECEQLGTIYNPTGAVMGSRGRVLRGGSWDSGAVDCRSASRIGINSDCRFHINGFRLVLLP